MEHDSLPLYPQMGPQTKVLPKETMNQQQPPMLPPHTNQLVLLGPENTVTVCPFCHASIKTAVKYTSTSRTAIASAICCLSCCCCIPYSMDSAKNADHYCPNCQRYIGTYHK